MGTKTHLFEKYKTPSGVVLTFCSVCGLSRNHMTEMTECCGYKKHTFVERFSLKLLSPLTSGQNE